MRLLLFRLSVMFLLVGAVPPATRALAGEEEAKTLLFEGEQLLRQRKPLEAVQRFRKADTAMGGQCTECKIGLARALSESGAYKDAIETMTKVIELKPDRLLLIQAYDVLGVALLGRAEDDKKALALAEEAFRKTQELSENGYPPGLFSLGQMLLKAGRDDEGVAALKGYLQVDPKGRYAVSAQRLVDRPVCGRRACAPDFSVVTTDGSYFTQDNLLGKVTVIHFWLVSEDWRDTMWTELRRLSGRSEKEPFQMIGLSAERDKDRAREFVARNRLTWPQGLDWRYELHGAFGVGWYPTQIVVDHEGMIVYRSVNWGNDRYDELNRAVGKALSELKKAPKGKAAPSPPPVP